MFMINETDMRTIMISGGKGFIGSALSAHFSKFGNRVVGLTRDQYSLGSPIGPNLFQGVDVFIHCAYNFKLYKRSEIWKENVDGSIMLIRAALEQGVQQVVHLSSMAAFTGTKSLYGQAKLAIEESLVDPRILHVRPGLVFSEKNPGGVLAPLAKLMHYCPMVPMVGMGNSLTLTIHIDDLCKSIQSLLNKERPVETAVCLVNPRPYFFKDLLRDLARSQGLSIILVPVPWELLYWSLKILEFAGFSWRLRSDSLLNLKFYDRNPDLRIANRLLANYKSYVEIRAVNER